MADVGGAAGASKKRNGPNFYSLEGGRILFIKYANAENVNRKKMTGKTVCTPFIPRPDCRTRYKRISTRHLFLSSIPLTHPPLLLLLLPLPAIRAPPRPRERFLSLMPSLSPSSPCALPSSTSSSRSILGDTKPRRAEKCWPASACPRLTHAPLCFYVS